MPLLLLLLLLLLSWLLNLLLLLLRWTPCVSSSGLLVHPGSVQLMLLGAKRLCGC
jgi:hypothetical protein